MVRGAFLGIASALLLAICSQAQTISTAGPPPVEVAVRPTGQQRQVPLPYGGSSVLVPERAVDIRNASDKCVVAISLSIQEKDRRGNWWPREMRVSFGKGTVSLTV